MPPARWYLGCPFWSFEPWCGTLFSRDARPREFLGQYARVFGTVEGNTTFYQTPAPHVARRWRDETPEDFRFCFKLPREITHERQLHDVARETRAFFVAMEPLADRLGPFMVQLPPAFGPDGLDRLEHFLAALPGDFHYAVELRHPAFFDEARDATRRADDRLRAAGVDRVILDTRPLRTGDDAHPDIVQARHQKPSLPMRAVRTGRTPIVRVVFHPDAAVNEPFLDEWVARVAGWLDEDEAVFFFVHTPSNVGTPQLARHLQGLLGERRAVGRLPAFPGESGESAVGQLSLL